MSAAAAKSLLKIQNIQFLPTGHLTCQGFQRPSDNKSSCWLIATWCDLSCKDVVKDRVAAQSYTCRQMWGILSAHSLHSLKATSWDQHLHTASYHTLLLRENWSSDISIQLYAQGSLGWRNRGKRERERGGLDQWQEIEGSHIRCSALSCGDFTHE